MRAGASARLAEALRNTGGTHQERSQRDSTIAMYTDQLAQWDAVDEGLCFGRLDFLDHERRYIGRIGIFDEHDREADPLLIDWRAPAARPFYLATAAAPEGVRRRRHLRTLGRRLTSVDDEVLDLAEAAEQGRHEGLTGEAVLLSALDARRTGRMRDIVETIQVEQDRIIRSELGGVQVVQGGPGTGKTAVALHRAAYLLYTHRRELSSRGVLVVGPNATFLRYISHVLPSLAETGVLLRTQADLFPGVEARGVESAEAAELKGRAALSQVVASAVQERQRVPEEWLDIAIDQHTLRESHLRLDREVCEQARKRARATGRAHNLARPLFETEIIHALSLQLADEIGTDPYANDPLGGDDAPGDTMLLDEADLAEFRRELRAEPGVQAALDWLWPVLTPQRLLSELFCSPERIEAAAPTLSEAERALLLRPRDAGWTPADVPLLDEAAELLGEDERDAEALAEMRRRRQAAYAEGTLSILHGSRPIDVEDEVDPEILLATDLLDASLLGERHEETERLTTAERAARDRKWTFGHIIVDEAQELSPMGWRLIMRRCPSHSMTLVGDVAQTSDLGGASSWEAALYPHVQWRWRLAELTVNYRTPSEVMAVARQVLARIDPEAAEPRSVRSTGVDPWLSVVDSDDLVDFVAGTAAREVSEVDGGRVAVLAPEALLADLRKAPWDSTLREVTGEVDLEDAVVVLGVGQAKGLEFDSVLVVDPDGIAAQSPRGANDLYVALTRTTQRLGVISPDRLPATIAIGQASIS